MSLPVKPWHIPPRLAAGAVILNAGLSKRDPDDATTAMLHGMAAGTYPFLRDIPPRQFVRLLSAWEIALGAALLLPVVPTALAGAGLTAFATALLGLYLRTPGMREDGSLRPTQQGTALVKDVWLRASAWLRHRDGYQRRRSRRVRFHDLRWSRGGPVIILTATATATAMATVTAAESRPTRYR